MDRRSALMGAIRTAVGLSAVKTQTIEPIAKSLASTLAVPTSDPYDGDEEWSVKKAKGAANAILGSLYDNNSEHRHTTRLDHSIKALKSCSPVYKAALQCQRDKERDIESVLKSYNGSVPDLMAELTKKFTSLS